MQKKDRIKFLQYLDELFPNAKCELEYKTPFQLLIAVILSAQCTDKKVNQVTPDLFKKYQSVYDFANANIEDIEKIIMPCGLYKNKAMNIVKTSKMIIENFNGEMPNNIKDMMKLSGVGMKTAKVVCSNIYGDNVIAVDTHVLRVVNRLGIVNESNPDKCSEKLEKIFRDNLTNLHHKLVLFGRYHCKAKKPLCVDCEMKNVCKYYKTKIKNIKM